MSDQKNPKQDHAKKPVDTDRPGQQRDTGKKPESRSNTTGAQPGMPQRNEQGRPTGHTEDRSTNADPNPGPGISSQGHRVDEDTPAHGTEQDKDRKQPSAKHDMPTKDQPRDQDKDRREPMDEHTTGNNRSGEAHKH